VFSKSIKKVEPELKPRLSGVLDADPFAYKTAHRRLAWLLRLSVATNVVLAAAFVIAIQAFSAILPLKETEIALLRADPADDRIYRVEPISVDVDGFELMLEKMARRYVRDILTIDGPTQNTRFETVRMFSDTGFFNDYLKTHEDTIRKALDDGLNRSITIRGAHQVDSYDGVYLYVVEFTQTDRIGRNEPRQRELRAFLEMTPRPHSATTAERYENPLGIRVLAMAVKEQASQ